MHKKNYGLALVLCIASLWSGQCAMAQPGDASVLDKGPQNLVIVYKCLPENRVALRTYMEVRGRADLAHWKADGVFADSSVLFSRSTDTDSWDLQVFLRFGSPVDARKWQHIEHSQPAGLRPEALHLITSVATYWLDLVESGEANKPTKSPVYLTIPYEVTVSTADYISYAHQYIIPQTQGWIAAGILQSYKLYVIRGSAGRPWSAILALVYVDDAALGEREKTVRDVREKLQDNAAWKAISNHKQSVRVERVAIIADPVN